MGRHGHSPVLMALASAATVCVVSSARNTPPFLPSHQTMPYYLNDPDKNHRVLADNLGIRFPGQLRFVDCHSVFAVHLSDGT